MSITIRTGEISDLEVMVELLMEDGRQREAHNQTLWKVDLNGADKVASDIRSTLENDNPPFRQQWLLAEFEGKIVGITHSILVPVPPVYAGELGSPGLLMEDCFVSKGAPAATARTLLDAAEADLRKAGAKILLAASMSDGSWETEYRAHNFEPLTLYLAKTGLSEETGFEGVRKATEEDVPSIVASSADTRRILSSLDEFWKPHIDADARFNLWMNYSLTLDDRDMFVSKADGNITGYAISQPATPLHFPIAHDISQIGIIDDYHHRDFENPRMLEHDGKAAATLLYAAEAALGARGGAAALIVCPAAWKSKFSVLKAAGYETEVTWFMKR
jgi:hypothetical protein